MLGVTSFAHFAAVHRHGAVALRVAADIIYTVPGAITIGGVAVSRYVGGVRALHVGALLFGVSRWVNRRVFVLKVGGFLSVSHGVRSLK